jgi:hypothetical protein
VAISFLFLQALEYLNEKKEQHKKDEVHYAECMKDNSNNTGEEDK